MADPIKLNDVSARTSTMAAGTAAFLFTQNQQAFNSCKKKIDDMIAAYSTELEKQIIEVVNDINASSDISVSVMVQYDSLLLAYFKMSPVHNIQNRCRRYTALTHEVPFSRLTS